MIQDERSENTLLASIMFNGDEEISKGLALDAIAHLDEMCFSNEWRREAFLAIKTILGKNGIPDSTNVASCCSVDVLNGICDISGHATTNDFTIIIEKLKNSSKARAVEMFAYSIPNRLLVSNDLYSELQDIDREFMHIVSVGNKKIDDEGFIGDFCGEWYKEKEKQMTTGETGFLSSGIKTIDTALGGFRGGDTVVIAGRTGMGKSSLAMTMIVNQIMEGYKPALFSIELGRVEIFDKMVSMISDIDSTGDCVPFKTLHNPAGAFGGIPISETQLKRVSFIVSQHLYGLNVYARGTGRITVEEIMSKTRKLVHEKKCDALYIDHIGLLVKDKNKEREELTHITNTLRIFAGEMNIPVFEVVQMNRTADTIKEKPKSSSMKGSGSIEEDASIILMPWRPFCIDKEKYSADESEIIIAKGRNGGEGIVPTYFCPKTTRFYESDKTYQNEIEKEERRIF